RMIDAAWSDLTKRVTDLLKRESLFKEHVDFYQVNATPRRLVVFVPGIDATQPDITEQLTGPSTKVAFKDGKPTPAGRAFAKKAGVDVASLQRITTPKGEYLAAMVRKKGRQADEILSGALPKELAAVYWPKNMYWRAGKPERFVRPVRWLVAMLDSDVIPLVFAAILS